MIEPSAVGDRTSVSGVNNADATVNGSVSGITTATISNGVANSISGQARPRAQASTCLDRWE